MTRIFNCHSSITDNPAPISFLHKKQDSTTIRNSKNGNTANYVTAKIPNLLTLTKCTI